MLCGKSFEILSPLHKMGSHKDRNLPVDLRGGQEVCDVGLAGRARLLLLAHPQHANCRLSPLPLWYRLPRM